MSLGLVGKVGEGVGGPSGGESVGGMAGGETDSSLPVMVLGGAARVDGTGTGCEPADEMDERELRPRRMGGRVEVLSLPRNWRMAR